MVYCSNCGKEVSKGVRFCPSCGASVTSGQTVTASSLAYADVGERFVAILIDTIILLIVTAIITFPLGILSFPFGNPMGFIFGGFQIISWLLWIGYFTYFEGTTGRTWGKQLTNLKVVDVTTGEPVEFGRAFLRNILRIVDWLPFLYIVGIILISTSERKQRLGDMLTRTAVVKS